MPTKAQISENELDEDEDMQKAVALELNTQMAKMRSLRLGLLLFFVKSVPLVVMNSNLILHRINKGVVPSPSSLWLSWLQLLLVGYSSQLLTGYYATRKSLLKLKILTTEVICPGPLLVSMITHGSLNYTHGF